MVQIKNKKVQIYSECYLKQFTTAIKRHLKNLCGNYFASKQWLGHPWARLYTEPWGFVLGVSGRLVWAALDFPLWCLKVVKVK